MNRKNVFIGGAVTYTFALGAGYYYSVLSKAKNGACSCNKGIELNDEERRSIYDKNAAAYDYHIGKDEFYMGLNILRYWHISNAKGKVLEVGCGTGRNFSYYSKNNVSNVVAIDYSQNMLKQAEKKLEDSKTTFNIFDKVDVPVELKQQDCHHLSDYGDNEFDTVVDTFGLCSYDNPEQALQEMARVCDKKKGKVILLEHGLGSYEFVNNMINQSADKHAKNWGCIYNRDIEDLVKRSGLEIVNISRWHFGTTYVIEAKPKVANEQQQLNS